MSGLVKTGWLCLRVLLALIVALPVPATAASGPGNLLCNPSGQPLSTAAQAQLDALEALLSAATGDDDQPSVPHCEDCLPPVMAIPTNLPLMHRPRLALVSSDWTSLSRLAASARGPPLGSRAPPYFV